MVYKRQPQGYIATGNISYLFNMKKVAILVPESSVMQAIADPQYLFSTVNQFMQMSGKAPLFEVKLVGISGEVQLGAFTVHTDHQINGSFSPDLIFIPALFGDMKQATALNQAFVPWILSHYQKGAEVASLCVGAFLLASTGLLNGRKCSTHWGFMNELKELYPEVEVVEGHIVTEEHRIYSSGGANSYWNLLLYLVEKYTDRDTAILASKYFAIDIDRDSQAAFAMFKGQKDHPDDEIRTAQEFIENNTGEKITIHQLAELVSVGKRSFERRFKKATNNTVNEYIQRVKVEAAKRSFESSRKNISEVMYDVGYTDTKAFRDMFRKITGLTPVEYRNKYNKSVDALKDKQAR